MQGFSCGAWAEHLAPPTYNHSQQDGVLEQLDCETICEQKSEHNKSLQLKKKKKISWV